MKNDNQKGWNQPGVITGEADTPRSYVVQTETGTTRRNRRHLQPAVPRQSVSPKKAVQDPLTHHASPIPDPMGSPGDSAIAKANPTPTAASTVPEPRRSGRVVKKPERFIEC